MSGAPQPPPAPPPPPIGDDTTAQYSGYVEGARVGTIPDGVEFLPRAGARLIDTLLHIGVGAGSALVMAVMVIATAAATGSDADVIIEKIDRESPMDFVVAVLGFVAYHTLCEGLHGSSLGKMLLGQVVVTDLVKPCGLRAALIRSLAYFVDGLFFGAIGYLAMKKTRLQKRHGDNWADTFVARRTQVPISSLRGTGRFFAVLALALAVDFAILIAWDVVKMM